MMKLSKMNSFMRHDCRWWLRIKSMKLYTNTRYVQVLLNEMCVKRRHFYHRKIELEPPEARFCFSRRVDYTIVDGCLCQITSESLHTANIYYIFYI